MAATDSEGAFRAVTRVVLGEELSGVNGYLDYLVARVPLQIMQLGKAAKFFPAFAFYAPVAARALPMQDALDAGKKTISKAQADGLTLSNAGALLREVSVYSPEVEFGNNQNVENCGICINAADCSDGTLFVNSRHCALSCWPRDSQYVIASSFVFSSSFCLRCDRSLNITRCFEVSCSSSCSGCYFCHDCENVRDGILCFNAKNLRYAVGNVEVGKEEYQRIKKMLLSEILERLKRGKGLSFEVYSLLH